MKNSLRWAFFIAAVVGLSGVQNAKAHCEIPCGIFDDHLRIHMIEEHITTINKGMAVINSLHQQQRDAQDTNQITRWINTKEDSANKIRDIMSQYFLAQRIKKGFGEKTYVDLLKKSHALIVMAMKAKQTVNDDIIDDMHKALKAFEKAYSKATKAKSK